MAIEPPYIDHLAWDDWNQEHISKHRVALDEVEEVAAGFPVFIETYKNRLLMVGPTRAGRLLSVVIGEDPDEPQAFYVFSARSASPQERRAYRREREAEDDQTDN